MADIRQEIERRRTFAIISHPDAGKTTLTEKFLLYGGAIQTAGSVKGKQGDKHAVSDWMELILHQYFGYAGASGFFGGYLPDADGGGQCGHGD